MEQRSQRLTEMERQRLKEELVDRYKWLQSLNDYELREVTLHCLMSPKGQQKQGERYFDISRPERGVIIGRAGEAIPEGSCYLPKSEVTEEIWNKVIRAAEEAGLTR